MIDYLLAFSDEAIAQADPVVGKYYTPATKDGPGAWRGDICFPGVKVFKITGTEEVTDPQTGSTYTQNIREYLPGWQLWITLPSLDTALRDLPNKACRIIADYDAWKRGNPAFVLYFAPDFDQSTAAEWHIEPSPAREVAYPFGNPPQP